MPHILEPPCSLLKMNSWFLKATTVFPLQSDPQASFHMKKWKLHTVGISRCSFLPLVRLIGIQMRWSTDMNRQPKNASFVQRFGPKSVAFSTKHLEAPFFHALASP